MVVKGVARFVNEIQLSRSKWMSFASTMAASVVAKMLNDPVVFQEWPHCKEGKLHHNNSNPSVKMTCIYNSKNSLKRSDFLKHLAIKNCEKTILKNI